jgi:hypothetical protein
MALRGGIACRPAFKTPVTEAVLPVGELAASGSKNGCAALVALKSSRRTVFWCDGAASQAESLCACLPQLPSSGTKWKTANINADF